MGRVTGVVSDNYGDALAYFEVNNNMVLEEVWSWRTHAPDHMIGV